MKQRIINFLFRKLLNAVVLDDVIKSGKDGTIYVGGRVIGDTEVRQLIAEAKALEGFALWRILNESIKDEALDRGWNKAKSMEELNAGKTMFYTLSLQNSIIRIIKQKERK